MKDPAQGTNASPADLIGIAARLDLNKLGIIGDCPVYLVHEPWRMKVLATEPGAAVVYTPQQLEDALANTSVCAVVVPQHTFGLTMLERILTRHAVRKIIYWEE